MTVEEQPIATVIALLPHSLEIYEYLATLIRDKQSIAGVHGCVLEVDMQCLHGKADVVLCLPFTRALVSADQTEIIVLNHATYQMKTEKIVVEDPLDMPMDTVYMPDSVEHEGSYVTFLRFTYADYRQWSQLNIRRDL